MFADLLSEAQKSAIADVAIAHAELEPELDRCIIELCNLHWPHGAVLIGSVRVDRKLEILSQLLEIEFRGQTVPEPLRTICTRLKELNSERNTIIHGQWTLRSLANYDPSKPRRGGSALQEIEKKDIVVRRAKRGKQPSFIAASTIKKTAELLALNRRLLHQLFWEYFPDRVKGLSGLPEKPDTTSKTLGELVNKRTLRKQ